MTRISISSVDWSRTTFVLLAPDSFARHAALPILERILEAGYRATAYYPIHRRPTELDHLYEKNIRTVWDAYRFRCVDLLFDFGPMVGLLVEDALAGREEDSHEVLRILKGDSDPMKAVNGSLRGDFLSINQTLSLIHISDTPSDAEYETTVFFPDEGPFALTDTPEELVSVCRMLTPLHVETRGFDEVLGGFRIKVAMSAWDELTGEGRALIQAWEDEGGVGKLAELGAGEKIIDHLSGAASHPLAAALRCEFQPDHPRENLARIRLLVGAYGVDLDRWEELVLTTSMFFPPRRSTRSAGPT